MKKGTLLAVLTFLIVLLSAQAAFALSGAIFTTNADGTWVNGNTKYLAKEDVYLDGGPGPNAPVTAASLPAGDYYFQVTDPSGKVLLSVDPIESRKVHINDYGVIDQIYPALVQTRYQGKWYGTHVAGVDADHGGAPWDAITVQLMPYENTPNNGGVYKVWITPVGSYSPGSGKWGFIPSESKTDNYKVKGAKIPPVITVKKFHDVNANGIWDAGEPELNWAVDITEPGFSAPNDNKITPFNFIAAVPGVHAFTELIPDVCPPWEQTALYIDGVAQTISETAYVNVAGTSGETHVIIFGNVRKVCVEAEKFYDKNANGVKDAGEGPVEGIKFILTGTNIKGETVEPLTAFSDENGKVKWCDLYAGEYTVEEVLPPDGCWIATTPTKVTKTIAEGAVGHYRFGNCCTCWVGFYTKGFWHNKNGLEILAAHPQWIAYVNTLAPYAGNPFDGLDEAGNPVPAAKGIMGEELAPAGTALAEISAFLVDSNSEYKQLEQQLLAFIFNAKNTGAMDGAVIGPDGTAMPVDDLIADALGAWSSGDGVTEVAGLLDWFNNHHIEEGHGLQIICGSPCEVVY